jgi:hypothetical protein
MMVPGFGVRAASLTEIERTAFDGVTMKISGASRATARSLVALTLVGMAISGRYALFAWRVLISSTTLKL